MEQILKALPSKRLPTEERHEAERMVMNAQVHSWLLSHSLKAVPRTELSRARRAVLRECFDVLDADSSGAIDLNELTLAMKALGFSADDTRQAFERGDQDGDGSIDFDEFCALFTIAWANRELHHNFTDGFARDMTAVLASRSAFEGDDSVTTTFPFALVANSHRISKLVDACNPQLRERHEGGRSALDLDRARTEAIAQQRASVKRMSIVPGDAGAGGRRNSEAVPIAPTPRRTSMTPRLPAISQASSPRVPATLEGAGKSKALAVKTPRQGYDLGSAP